MKRKAYGQLRILDFLCDVKRLPILIKGEAFSHHFLQLKLWHLATGSSLSLETLIYFV